MANLPKSGSKCPRRSTHCINFFLVASPKIANLNFLIKKFLPFFSSSRVNKNNNNSHMMNV